MFLLLAMVARAAPTCPASPAEFGAAIDDAERAFSGMDPVGLRHSVEDAEGEISCFVGPVAPLLAARLHRAEALRAFVDGDEAATRRALLAARVLDPTGEFSTKVVPVDHPIRALDPGVPKVAPASLVLPAPGSGSVYFDGHATLSRPADRPTVYQFIDPRGNTVQGDYLRPEITAPAYPPGMAAAAAPAVVKTTKSGHTSVPLAVVGGALLVGAGVTYALAGAAHAQFEDPATPRDEIEGLYGQTNGLVYTSIGLGAVGLGTGLTALVVAKW